MDTHHLLTGRIQVGSRETIKLKEYYVISYQRNHVIFIDGGNLILVDWDQHVQRIQEIVHTSQEGYSTPLDHTPSNPPSQLRKESQYSLLVKVEGCVRKVC